MALVENFTEKYYDHPVSQIDALKDLLYNSYTKKSDCIKPGLSYRYHFKKYKSLYTGQRFKDFIYQEFNPPKLMNGYMLVGYTVNENGKLVHPTIYSTTANKDLENQLFSILYSSDTWVPRKINEEAVESTDLLVFQFYNGTYKILSDSRTNKPAVDNSAEFKQGNDELSSLIENNIKLPQYFYNDQFNIGFTFGFYIDEDGNYGFDKGLFSTRDEKTIDEQTLHHELNTLLQSTNGLWKAAISDNKPTTQYFIGNFVIRNGSARFKFHSNSWILN